ncbi:MAG: transcription termination/antitermination protein NusG [bacterium]|nr:transcription termination/antitermination protein NusG [Candidatus Jorgensenbacteria bacterium]
MSEKKEQMINHERRWYAVHTYAGYEDAVSRYLKQRVESMFMSDKIFNVIVPKETKIKVKGGKRYTIEEKTFPGYVLVEMILDHDSWSVVRNTPRVTGFVGSDSTTPTPLSDEEIKSLLMKMSGEETKYTIDIKVGEIVKITDGPFKEQEGKVADIDEEHGKVKVLVPIFGRDTLLELDSLQVQKI